MITNHKLIRLALEEDIGTADVTTEHLIGEDAIGRGRIVAKEEIVLAGIPVAQDVFKMLDPTVRFGHAPPEGTLLSAGSTLLEIDGKLGGLLSGERTALNFLQRLSGIATHVRTFAEEIKDLRVRLVDTRKTTPGWRTLEKYAVRVGGAHNHRMGLFDAVLIKDNHIAACGGIKPAIARIRESVSHLTKIEVEVADLAGVEEALTAGVDVIMLDNMALPLIEQAVALIKGRVLVEVSGNVGRQDLRRLAATGIDIISVGALTHAARCVDISMRITAPA